MSGELYDTETLLLLIQDAKEFSLDAKCLFEEFGLTQEERDAQMWAEVAAWLEGYLPQKET